MSKPKLQRAKGHARYRSPARAVRVSSAKVDRRADKSARDDRETNLRESKAEVLKNQKRNNSKHETRRQDFEARIGALQGERGDKPRWLSHKRAEAIRDSSPKANAHKY